MRRFFFGPLPAVPQFDVILFTPPFLDGGVRTPFDHALFDHRQSLVRRMLVQARTYLRSGGYVQMLYSTIAHANRVVAMTSELGWECHTLARQKRLMETFVIWRLTPRPDPARLVPFPSTSVCNNTADAG